MDKYLKQLSKTLGAYLKAQITLIIVSFIITVYNIREYQKIK